jgi:hypothetical protein
MAATMAASRLIKILADLLKVIIVGDTILSSP